MDQRKKFAMEGNQRDHEQHITVRLGDGIEFTGTISVSGDYDDPTETCEEIESAIRDTLITLTLEL